MTITFTDQDKTTVRTAAYGAISLMAAAAAAGGSAHRAGTHGAVALCSATGQIGHILGAPKDVKLTGKTIAGLADQVLPALTDAMTLLGKKSPAEADNFRNTVLVAIDAAAHSGKRDPGPVITEMARKITVALDAA